jgi:hypothetical protein
MNVLLPIVQIGRTNATGALSVTTRPVATNPRRKNTDQRISAKRPALLTVRRLYDGPAAGAAGLVEGTIKIWGALLGMIEGALAGAAQTAQRFFADGSAATFQTDITYAAYSTGNWAVRKLSDSRGAITGTVTVTAASKTVAGSGTAFDTECHVGELIAVGTQVREIQSIASATSLTVSLAFDTTSAGATAVGAVAGYSGATGTVAVTAGSSAVTGTSTVFTEEVQAGQDIIIAGNAYKVQEVNSNTALVLSIGALATNAVARAFVESDQFLTYDATPDNAWDFGVSSGVGAMAIITLGAAPLAGSIYEVYKVTPAEVLADGVHVYDKIQTLGYDIYWGVATGDGTTYDLSAVRAELEPAFTI